jgi:hypothetical protein
MVAMTASGHFYGSRERCKQWEGEGGVACKRDTCPVFVYLWEIDTKRGNVSLAVAFLKVF